MKNKAQSAEQPLGAGMLSWVEGLRGSAEQLPPPLAAKLEQLAHKLDETREAGFQAVEELQMPHYIQLTMPLSVFLGDTEKYFNTVKSKTYYAYIIKSEKGAVPLFRAPMMKKEAIMSTIEKKILPDQYDEYQITVCENYTQEYGGNAVVNPDQSIVVEVIKGNQGLISTGQATPSYYVRRSSLEGGFTYNFDDEDVRRLFYSTVKEIPHDGQFYLPGYYEFHLVKKKEDGPIEPIFIYYRRNPAYYTKNDIEE